MQLFVASSEKFHYFSPDDVRTTMNSILDTLPEVSCVITAGGGGAAYIAAKAAAFRGITVHHSIPRMEGTMELVGMVDGAIIKRSGCSTGEWKRSMLKDIDMFIMFEGAIHAFEEALIAEKNGAHLVLFPESSYYNYVLTCAKADVPQSCYRAPSQWVNVEEIDALLKKYKVSTTMKKGYRKLLDPKIQIQLELIKDRHHVEEAEDTNHADQAENTTESNKRKKLQDDETEE